jgi:hypothetical protein
MMMEEHFIASPPAPEDEQHLDMAAAQPAH